jgi:hypothetical protein
MLVATAGIPDHRHESQLFCKTSEDVGCPGTMSGEIALGSRFDVKLLGKTRLSDTDASQSAAKMIAAPPPTSLQHRGRGSASILACLTRPIAVNHPHCCQRESWFPGKAKRHC